MKTTKFIGMALLGLTISLTPAYAQRGGGGGGRGGGGGSYSGGSRSGGSFSGGGSRSGGSYNGNSRSSSSSSSGGRSISSSSSGRSTYSGPSRSSYSTPNNGTSRSSYGDSRVGSSASRSSYSNSRSTANEGRTTYHSTNTRTGSVPSEVRRRSSRDGYSTSRSPQTTSSIRNGAAAVGRPATATGGRGATVSGRPSGTPPSYARPGCPGPLPPSCRPIHPAPYFYNPCWGVVVHCHPLYWDPCPIRTCYWPGFWVCCNSYWYDYHVTDIVVVREYVREKYEVELITYAISGKYMYALVDDPDGHTYLQIYDDNDKLLAEQRVSRKYCKLEVDPENGGCWIMKKRDKDPLLFFYTDDNQLLIYEAD